MKKLVIFYGTFVLLSFGFWVQESPLQKSMQRGSEVYAGFCMNCHLPDGKGVDGVIPPLADSDYLLNKQTESIKAVKFGQRGKIIVNGKTYDSFMASMGLTDKEAADVMNYILNSWGNASETLITPEDVARLKND